ncbi:MAG: 7,8-didemethyl-8-hydroxy-5-deazariboflavin synthase subunit CofG [Candidatus Helarchaeota archaeon]
MLNPKIMELIHKCETNENLRAKDFLIVEHLDQVEFDELRKYSYELTKEYSNYITFSKNIFIPITNICRNKCSYCGFRKEPFDPEARLMNFSEIKELLKQAKMNDCKEVLLTFGEKPEDKYPIFRKMLKDLGNYSSLHEYHLDICKLVIETGLLPHSNPGLLSSNELKEMKEINASMGLMLESSSEKLCDKGGPHEKSPSKHPKIRIKMIEDAGRLKIPFTTGILIGIGETFLDRIKSLLEIRRINEKYGHIQEIIIQNFVPKKNTEMQDLNSVPIEELMKIIVIARLIFKDSIPIQVPPNLTFSNLDKLLMSGINDLGGISPITLDEINPEMKWPTVQLLESICNKFGFHLKERLPVYPKFINNEFLSEKVLKIVNYFQNQ